MDHLVSKEQYNGFDRDLESGTGVIRSNEELDQKMAKTIFLKLCDGLTSLDENSVKSDSLNVNPKKGSNAKKPPRPPGGFSLNASDQKLIKELAQLAIIKRARIERMKALKEKKQLKVSSSTTSHGSFFAVFFTIIFFLVLLFQGRNSGVSLQGSPQTNGNDLIVIQNRLNLSANDSFSPNSESSTLF